LAQIKWTEEDVIKKVQEAMVPQGQEGKPNIIQSLLDKAKSKIKLPEGVE